MFLRHTSCPSCSSSDAFAEYSGGSGYCFSCGFYQPPTGSLYVLEAARYESALDEKPMREVPFDACFDYGKEMVEWAAGVGIGIPELIEHNVLWSPSKKQMIYSFYEETTKPLASSFGSDDAFGKPVLWQARNFGAGYLKYVGKYSTNGPKEDYIPLFRSLSLSLEVQRVVIVEDCLSAIKVVRLGGVAVPCLGSTMGRDKLARLRAVFGPSSAYVVWLDSNMYDKAQQISQRLSLLGARSRVVWSQQDPKYYDEGRIAENLA